MINMEKYDFLIFDCDGVILDSNLLKSRAFAESLLDEPPELVKSFVDYHKQHGGISRYEKFKYYFTDILNYPDAENKINEALFRFARIVKKGLIECNYVPGIQEFLKQQAAFEMPMFVVSGSDEKELQEVFIKRGIEHYFNKIYGSPANKVENTSKVVSNIDNSKFGLFFGDSKSDYEAASKFGIDFIFVKDYSEWRGGELIAEESTCSIIDNFNELSL